MCIVVIFWEFKRGRAVPDHRRHFVKSTSLVSLQVALEPGGEDKIPRIRLTATVSGEWVKLVNFMVSLQVHRPPFWVRTANITREGMSSGPGPQNARLTLQLEAPLVPEKANP